MVASAAEGDLGRNPKQDEPKKKRGRPPKRQLKQPPNKGPPTRQKRRGRPSKSETKQANIERYFEDKPAKLQQKLRQSRRLSQEDCDDLPTFKGGSIYDNALKKTQNTGQRGGPVSRENTWWNPAYPRIQKSRRLQRLQQKDTAAALSQPGQFEGITISPNRSSPPPLLQLPNVTGLSCFFSSALLLLQDR